MNCTNCGLVHKGRGYVSDADCFTLLQEEIDRLKDIILNTNNILFEACRHADDVDHTVECHPDTIEHHFRAIAEGVNAAMKIVSAEVLNIIPNL